MNSIQQTLTNLLPAKKKQTPSGWVSFNAPCCVHNGESSDNRGRGGLKIDGSSISYHCFNCNYKTGWQPGWHLSYKFRKLLSWFGADDREIQRLVLEAIRVRDETEQLGFDVREFTPNFETVDLPECVPLYTHPHSTGWDYPGDFIDCLNYLQGRELPEKSFRWTTKTANRFNRRVILPFYFEGQTVGYTARSIDPDTKPKYFTRSQPGYVFNMDAQDPSRKFVLVTEGPFDALCIDGVATLGNEINEQQVDLIDRLGKQVILVPDNDSSGKRMIDQAIEFGWSVSFPEWYDTCKDVNEAVVKYGKLFVFRNILKNTQMNKVKIEVLKKKIND